MGPVVVWIHGGSVEDSSVMVADLEPFFELVEDYTYARKAEDLLAWLDGLGIREAVWGGASIGGARFEEYLDGASGSMTAGASAARSR